MVLSFLRPAFSIHPLDLRHQVLMVLLVYGVSSLFDGAALDNFECSHTFLMKVPCSYADKESHKPRDV